MGEEALARLVRLDGTVQAAGGFIDTASRFGLLPAIDLTVLRETLARGQKRQTRQTPRRLAFVNASTALLTEPPRLAALTDALTGILGDAPASLLQTLVIEITERDLVADLAGMRTQLEPLLARGVRLALDDFGSGFSSFLYLADLPISFLKIEQKLTARIAHDLRIAKIVRTLSDLAHDLGITTIAEGIEDATTAQAARGLGVDWGQGYFLGRPRGPAASTSKLGRPDGAC